RKPPTEALRGRERQRSRTTPNHSCTFIAQTTNLSVFHADNWAALRVRHAGKAGWGGGREEAWMEKALLKTQMVLTRAPEFAAEFVLYLVGHAHTSASAHYRRQSNVSPN